MGELESGCEGMSARLQDEDVKTREVHFLEKISGLQEQVVKLNADAELMQAEMQQREAACREREDQLWCEIRGLEEANEQMSQQAQNHYDEIQLEQERMAADIQNYQKAQDNVAEL